MLCDADIQVLSSLVGEENVSVRGSDLEAHSIDESWFEPRMPDVIVWPENAQQISSILKLANDKRIPVVPWSGGSSLEGNPVPVEGGILLAMYRMNRILKVREEDLQVVVQPGIVYDDLNNEMRRLGMFFPPAPGSADVATIGGMVANNSSGMRAVKYGVTRDYVLNVEMVLPDGKIVRIGTNAKKSTSGYDILSLVVGSEGTLGVVTEVTLRLVGFPEAIACTVAEFDEVTDAANTVYEVMRYGLGPSAIELLDTATVRVTNQQQGLSLRETPTLFVEFHGTEGGVMEQVEYLQELCEDNDCKKFEMATTPEARERLWLARAEAHDSIKFSHPGKVMISGDVCVPISRFADMVEFVHETSERLNLQIYAFGHAGDGNLHTETIALRADADEFSRGTQATDEIVQHALKMGGTVAGEHGIGLGKRHFMQQEHGDSLSMMAAIKNLFDPNGIMNPGKIFPTTT